MENKPNVFPASLNMNDAMKEANEMGTKIAEQAAKEMSIERSTKTDGELSAQEQMKKDTLDNLERQMKERDALIARKKAEAMGETIDATTLEQKPQVTYSNVPNTSHKKLELPDEEKYAALSQPQIDAPFDVIKLPSEGLLYKNRGSSLKVAYLNATDENIITNPNLLRSGKFLEVLINRKILDPTLRYKDLHVGDRNAIMIWLRSTGYGPMYNIILNDPENNYAEFEAEIDLSELPIKNLSIKPDEDGYFSLKLPLSKKTITFRLLTVGDVEDVDDHIESMTEEVGPEFTDASTYTLKKQIISVDGVTDSETVINFVEKGMRIGDVRAFRKYVNEIESGIDMNLTVGTPGGGSIKTFLPLNTSFFWPDLGI